MLTAASQEEDLERKRERERVTRSRMEGTSFRDRLSAVFRHAREGPLSRGDPIPLMRPCFELLHFSSSSSSSSSLPPLKSVHRGTGAFSTGSLGGRKLNRS